MLTRALPSLHWIVFPVGSSWSIGGGLFKIRPFYLNHCKGYSESIEKIICWHVTLGTPYYVRHSYGNGCSRYLPCLKSYCRITVNLWVFIQPRKNSYEHKHTHTLIYIVLTRTYTNLHRTHSHTSMNTHLRSPHSRTSPPPPPTKKNIHTSATMHTNSQTDVQKVHSAK